MIVNCGVVGSLERSSIACMGMVHSREFGTRAVAVVIISNDGFSGREGKCVSVLDDLIHAD